MYTSNSTLEVGQRNSANIKTTLDPHLPDSEGGIYITKAFYFRKFHYRESVTRFSTLLWLESSNWTDVNVDNVYMRHRVDVVVNFPNSVSTQSYSRC